MGADSRSSAFFVCVRSTYRKHYKKGTKEVSSVNLTVCTFNFYNIFSKNKQNLVNFDLSQQSLGTCH